VVTYFANVAQTLYPYYVDKHDFILWATKLADSYQISPQLRSELASIDLIALVGPTGVGKSTIIQHLKNIPFVLSDVTRSLRPGEKKGKDYHFREDYLEILNDIKMGKYVQFLVSKSAEFYGTRRSSYPDSGPCTMAIIASAIPTFRKLGFRSVRAVYVTPPSYVEWMRRIGGDSRDDLLARIAEARESLGTAAGDPDYQFVLNDDIEQATEDVRAVARGEKLEGRRTDLAKATVDILLDRLGETDLGL
jgi:guanylate kinase